MVDHQALRHRRQVGARFAQGELMVRLIRWRACQQAHKRIVRQVGRLVRALQLAAQPAQQPAVVLAVDRGDGIGGIAGGGEGKGHDSWRWHLQTGIFCRPERSLLRIILIIAKMLHLRQSRHGQCCMVQTLPQSSIVAMFTPQQG